MAEWLGLEVFAPIFADTREEPEEAKRFMQECPVKHKAYLRLPYLPVGMDIMYAGVMGHYPENHGLSVDNIWTTASIDALLPHIKEIATTLPTAPTHMLWLNWYPPKPRPDMAFSMEENIYIALYSFWKSSIRKSIELADRDDGKDGLPVKRHPTGR
ncbi:MAG: hypothetical protein AAF639_34960 [Chloroflexota bacterium]